MRLSSAFIRNIRNTFGEKGEHFLQELPALLDACAQRWQLTLGPPFDNLSYNYVAPAVRADEEEVVLKLGVPHRELWSEIEALTFFAGRGCVRLFDADAVCGALLLERLRPGHGLRTLVEKADDLATAVIAEVMEALWHPAPSEHTMLTIEAWARELETLRPAFDGGCGPFPPHLVEAAEHLFPELLASSGPAVVLHGDLHHENILATGEGGWLAIDPKGVIGEREFEAYAMLRNPLGWPLAQPNPARVLKRRIDRLAERLGLDRERMRLWAVAQCVLSAWWDYGEGAGRDFGAKNDDLLIAQILWEMGA
ncbi:MAG: aminoglycoside phosphotransferase family protein [Caldilinea sp.]|nr:aminoglycoside phosphotransferase family protein [Caldilinea sp.]MDW8440788.1 aminoglycoside phosphotransferase family protein [Caldilineaceae bacterium]